MSPTSPQSVPPTCLQGRLGLPEAEGQVTVESSPVLGRMLAYALGLPPSGPSLVRLIVTSEQGTDRWQRTFARRGFTTRMRLGPGTAVERLGPGGLVFDLIELDDGATLRLRNVTLGPLGIPVTRIVELEVSTERGPTGFTIDTHLRRRALRGGTSTLVLRYRGSLRCRSD